MLKVIIVDDEILIRVGIKSCIHWEQEGLEVVGQAEDGMQALELIGIKLPDIVITDIKMPNMDGLELIKIITQKYRKIKVIVLSCYDEIEYVKMAMKMGAEDYILKLSMQPEDLLEVLKKTKQSIKDEKEESNELLYLKNELGVNKYLIKENLYRKLINGIMNYKTFKKGLIKLGVEIDFNRFFTLCIAIDDYMNATMKSKLDDRDLLKTSFINILEELIAYVGKFDIAEISNGEFIVVGNLFEECNDKNFKKTIKNSCERINSALKKYLNISVSLGVSGMAQSIDDLRTRYLNSQIALEHKFYYGRECVLFHDELNSFIDQAILLDFQNEKYLTNRLENLDSQGAKDEINGFINELFSMKVYLPARVRIAAVEILHSLIKLAKKYEMDAGFITYGNGESQINAVMNAETIIDIKKFFEELVDKFVHYLADVKGSTERREILNLKSYIIEHISENITLEKAARISNISKSYLSSVFKKETGENFTDFVNRVKMEEARELIQKFDLKTYEAAERVGMFDESYFSKLFKRHIGVSPSKVNKIQ